VQQMIAHRVHCSQRCIMLEAICSSETSVDTQHTTQRYIPEDGTFNIHRVCCNSSAHYLLTSVTLDLRSVAAYT
jgi:hypothetical protein